MTTPLCLFWTLRRERNMIMFDDEEISVHRMKNMIMVDDEEIQCTG